MDLYKAWHNLRLHEDLFTSQPVTRVIVSKIRKEDYYY